MTNQKTLFDFEDMERTDEHPQWGGTMSLGQLDSDTEAEIVNRMREAGIAVGEAPGDGQYIVNITDE